MKAIQYTTAITLTLLIGATAIQAQSTRRNAEQERKERVSVQSGQSRNARVQPDQPQRVSVQSDQSRNARVQPDQPQRTRVQSGQSRNARVQPDQPQRTMTQARRQAEQAPEVRRPEVRPERRPVSISTGNNPRSTYRKPDSRVIVSPPRDAGTRVNKYSTKRYYGGNYYHNAYPRNSVTLHYHYDTYMNHYNVLYYPSYTNIYWTRDMYRDYRNWYPNYHWHYRYGYRIQTIPVFDARYNLGEVAMVYGRVYATWYNDQTDDYLFFFGGNYPQHQFTMVIPGRVARKFSRRPERFFLGEHITVTGLITTFDGIPEIIVKNKRQVGLY